MAKDVKNDVDEGCVLVGVPIKPGLWEAVRVDARAYRGIRELGYKEGYAAGELEARRDAAEARLEAAALRLQLMHPEMLPPSSDDESDDDDSDFWDKIGEAMARNLS